MPRQKAEGNTLNHNLGWFSKRHSVLMLNRRQVVSCHSYWRARSLCPGTRIFCKHNREPDRRSDPKFPPSCLDQRNPIGRGITTEESIHAWNKTTLMESDWTGLEDFVRTVRLNFLPLLRIKFATHLGQHYSSGEFPIGAHSLKVLL